MSLISPPTPPLLPPPSSGRVTKRTTSPDKKKPGYRCDPCCDPCGGHFGNPANLLFRGAFSSHPAPARLSPENKSRGFPSLGHPRFGVSVQVWLMAQKKKSRTSAYNFTCDGWVKTGDWLSVRAVGFALPISEKPRRVQGGMVYGSITSCWPGVGLFSSGFRLLPGRTGRMRGLRASRRISIPFKVGVLILITVREAPE